MSKYPKIHSTFYILHSAFILALVAASCSSKLRDIALTTESMSLYEGDTYQLGIDATPEDADFTAVWTSSAPYVASVNATGLVVARSAGTCTVTVDADGHTASCEVVVMEAATMPGADVGVTDYGAVDGYFSVSNSRQVQFACGNLQYQASSGSWRFAETQWSCRGADNRYISSGTDRWIDLFGWGTSGDSTGAVANQPWTSDSDDAHYIVGGDTANGIYGPNAIGDWGRVNHIQNHDERSGSWRVLTADEWRFLIGDNGLRANRWALATINGIFRGLILIPDQWTAPDDAVFTAGKSRGYATNSYSYQQWLAMQSTGVVFLPAAGVRDGLQVNNVNIDGYYWSATPDGDAACTLGFCSDEVTPGFGRYRHLGLSVRLVID